MRGIRESCIGLLWDSLLGLLGWICLQCGSGVSLQMPDASGWCTHGGARKKYLFLPACRGLRHPWLRPL